MPYIELKTNGRIPDKDALMRMLGSKIQLLPGKTERWLMGSLEDGCSMFFAGSDELCAMVKVSLFGSAGDGDFERMTDALCSALSSELSIPGDRIYIKYEEVAHWGWNGGNF